MSAVPKIRCSSQAHLKIRLFLYILSIQCHTYEITCVFVLWLGGWTRDLLRSLHTWIMWWFHNSCTDTVMLIQKDLGWFGFFVPLLRFITAELKSVFYVQVVVTNASRCLLLQKVALEDPDDPQAAFPFSGGMREGREKRQKKLHKLLMVPCSWNLLSLWVVARTVVMHVTPAEPCSVGVETWCSFSVDMPVIF